MFKFICRVITTMMLLLFVHVASDNELAGIQWNDLAVHTKTNSEPYYLLHPSSGFVPKGHVCGIIGPSGSGKSTMLAALGGTTSKHTGLEISGSIGWHDGHGNITTLSIREGQVAWLQQHDTFFSMLTTRETLDLASFLQFPFWKQSERDDLVEKSLNALGLKHVQHRPIGDRSSTALGRGGGGNGNGGGLSGGERRRLSVALELMTTPFVFLADEPTTGLDSSQAAKVMRLLTQLAKDRDIPCLCSIHQPRASIWKMLDSFVLLSPGGYVCYMGSRVEAKGYFAKLGHSCPPDTNPAEFYIDLVSVDTEDPVEAAKDESRIAYLATEFARHSSRTSKTESSGMDTPSAVWQNSRATKRLLTSNLSQSTKDWFQTPLVWVRRSGALLQRSWRQNIRNHRVNALRLGASAGNAFLFSQIFKTVRKGVPTAKSIADRVALLSYGVINMSMMALMKTTDLFARERPVVDREQMRQQYSSIEYLLSKVIAEIPLDACFAAIFTTILKATTNLRISWAQLTGTFALMTVAGAALGFAIGSTTPNAEAAMATGVPLMVIFMVVGIINPSGVDKSAAATRPKFLQWLKLGSPIKWAIEALCVAEYKGMMFEDPKGRFRWGDLKDLPKLGAFVNVRNGDQVLDALGLEEATYSQVMTQLAVLSGVNLLISWLGLHFGGSSFVRASNNSKQDQGRSSRKKEALTIPIMRNI